jgi:sugar (pentulose or hexulose) kinase
LTALLGVDLGTTAVKCALLSETGELLGSASREYQLLTPDPRTVEVDAETYWTAFTTATAEALDQAGVPAADIVALSFSAQGETLIPCDDRGAALRRAIVWLDNRAGREAEELKLRFDQQAAYCITGQVEMLPTWPAAKLLWLRRHEPSVFEQTDRFLLLEDYFIQRLTGLPVTEGSLVCSSYYWDISTKLWWADMLDYLEVGADRLPSIAESGTAIGTILPDVASALGLSPHTVVVSGGLDQACGALGVGNTTPNILSENTGAALAICVTSDGVTLDPAQQMPCHYHAIPDTYMLHTFSSGGIALRWFRDFLRGENALSQGRSEVNYELLSNLAAPIPPGSDGLLALPHLQGALAPEPNPLARGVFFGFGLTHTWGHFARAVLEGVCFAVRQNIEAVSRMGVDVAEIRALGGGARSPVWKQIEADVTGLPVSVTTDHEAASRGAAMLAGIGAGVFAHIDDAVRAMVSFDRTFEPNPASRDAYDEAYAAYRQLFRLGKPLFERYR